MPGAPRLLATLQQAELRYGSFPVSRVKACLSFWADMKAWERQRSGDLIRVPVAN